jgi:hypothetical protein
MLRVLTCVWLVLLGGIPSARASGPVPPSAPEIASLLKPEALRRIVDSREIVTHASLDEIQPGSELRRYSIYAAMLVHASLSRTRAILTDYRAYAKIVPYIDKAEFIHEPDLLAIEGGIWKFKLRSNVHFEERARNWISYRIVAGHFQGLAGDFFFESRGEKGTLVYMRGEKTGPSKDWPPKFVIEKGAEIVFDITSKRMRSYVEDSKTELPGSPGPGSAPSNLPQPRSHL